MITINFIELGKKIYDLNNPRELHRFTVFLARCLLHSRQLNRLEKFFSSTEILREVAENFPFVYEQATRSFFYYKSKFDERVNLIENHMNFLQSNFNDDFLRRIYRGDKIELWKKNIENLGDMRLVICIEPGQRKEGLLSAMLRLNDDFPIYQIMFWISQNNLYIGAMQGPNVDNAKELVKIITKKSHAYRTKNLILYATQAITRAMNLKKIFAVTNYGYYANNHIRRDRKLKTSFSDFWLECGGNFTDDERFIELPTVELRKNFEEIPTHKRALYRRRFAMLDEIDNSVSDKIKSFTKIVS